MGFLDGAFKKVGKAVNKVAKLPERFVVNLGKGAERLGTNVLSGTVNTVGGITGSAFGIAGNVLGQAAPVIGQATGIIQANPALANITGSAFGMPGIGSLMGGGGGAEMQTGGGTPLPQPATVARSNMPLIIGAAVAAAALFFALRKR